MSSVDEIYRECSRQILKSLPAYPIMRVAGTFSRGISAESYSYRRDMLGRGPDTNYLILLL